MPTFTTKLRRCFTLCLLFLTVLACQKDPVFDTSTEEFILAPGFSIQTIAAEPLLDSPVAMSFDKKGRIWVVELTGYMRDIDGSDEQKPDGRIVVLEDTDQDGRMDKREVILSGLETPRTLLPAYGGLLYSNGTGLWWAELDGTKVLDQVLVDSLYVVGGNIEHQPNGLLYNIDNWIYSAKSNSRYRLKDGKWLREATTARGQWGLSNDINGRLYYNNNSVAILADFMMPNQLIQNPYQKIHHGLNQDIAPSKRLFAYQATAVNRGYQEGVLDEEGKIKNMTSACSPLVYTGPLLTEDCFQDVFVCAPEGNLVKRYDLKEELGITSAVPYYDSTEFLVSKEETFRPVNLYNGPDGALYILDLRKGIIQHRAYMTSYLREKILNRGLDSINGLGRIYRVVADEFMETQSRNFSNLNDQDLLELLQSSTPYDRNFAQQELVFRQAKEVIPSLETLALDSERPYVQLHAIWTLEGLGAFSEDIWTKLTSQSNQALIEALLIRLSSLFPERETQQLAYFGEQIELNHPYLDWALAIRLGQMEAPEAWNLLLRLVNKCPDDEVLQEAILSGATGKEKALLAAIPRTEPMQDFRKKVETVLSNQEKEDLQAPQLPSETFKDNRTAGFDLFNGYCSSCHGLDGRGKDELAPPLLNSEYVGGSTDRLIALVLNGLQGPITVDGEVYEMNAVMPGIKDNPALTDKDIADLLVFLRNSFSFSDTYVSEEQVAKWREATKDREKLFTEEELKDY